MAPKPRPLAERLEQHSDRSGGPNACWPWLCFVHENGYGVITVSQRTMLVHRIAYTEYVGPIAEGFTVDHLCHDPEQCPGGKTCPHRRCTNPSHLGLKTRGDNARRANNANARKTHCKQGHKFTPENTRFTPAGKRICATCKRGWDQALRDRAGDEINARRRNRTRAEKDLANARKRKYRRRRALSG